MEEKPGERKMNPEEARRKPGEREEKRNPEEERGILKREEEP